MKIVPIADQQIQEIDLLIINLRAKLEENGKLRLDIERSVTELAETAMRAHARTQARA